MKIRILKPITLQYPNALIIPLLSQDKCIKVMELQSKCKKGLEVEFKPYSERKTNNMNSYMWALCDKIAKDNVFKGRRGNPQTDKEVYREAVREKGVSEYVLVEKDRFENVKKFYESDTKSVGNQLIKLQENDTYYQCKICFGTSKEYSIKDMSYVIDYIIAQAEELGIETLTPKELAKLKSQWGNREEKEC